jgi:hypothetical protein
MFSRRFPFELDSMPLANSAGYGASLSDYDTSRCIERELCERDVPARSG